MTTEEKAHKYCLSHFKKEGYTTRDRIERSMLFMAKWCDEQYSEEKKELLGLVKMLPVDEHNQTIVEDLVAMLNL